MKYEVYDIRKGLFGDNIIIEAKSPIEAVKKLYPDCKVARDYNGKGDIVVTGRFEYRYGTGYKKYVYEIIETA